MDLRRLLSNATNRTKSRNWPDLQARRSLKARLDSSKSMSAPTSTSDGTPFLPGHLFAGRYRMVTQLGRGGMGEVWQADDLVLQTPVALKLIHSNSDAGREAIINEARLARQITHPSVCRVFDVGEAEGQRQ